MEVQRLLHTAIPEKSFLDILWGSSDIRARSGNILSFTPESSRREKLFAQVAGFEDNKLPSFRMQDDYSCLTETGIQLLHGPKSAALSSPRFPRGTCQTPGFPDSRYPRFLSISTNRLNPTSFGFLYKRRYGKPPSPDNHASLLIRPYV